MALITGIGSNFNQLTAGTGINLSNTGGNITITNTAPSGSLPYTNVTGTTQTIAPSNAYGANNAGLVTFTMPTTAAAGTIIEILGVGAGGWTIVYTTGQSIVVDTSTSTVTSGSVSGGQGSGIALLCTVANTTWQAQPAPVGLITVL